MSRTINLQSILTSPSYGFKKVETMSVDACQYFYVCENCKTRLKPHDGDYCVFCSYGTEKCPPMQNDTNRCN